jgi:hypothetical protein
MICGIAYSGEIGLVTDSLAGGDILIVARVGQVGVASLVVDDIVVVGVTVFPPVSIQSLCGVCVLMHFKF